MQFFTFREKDRLRVFGNRVSSIMSGPKREEVTGRWIKLCKNERNLVINYESSNEGLCDG
jgi:hypothetical protein